MEKLTGWQSHRPQSLIFYVLVLSRKTPGWSPPRGRGIFREGRPPSSSRDARIGHGPEIEGLEPEREAGLEVTTLSGGGKPHGGAVSTRAVPPLLSYMNPTWFLCVCRVPGFIREAVKHALPYRVKAWHPPADQWRCVLHRVFVSCTSPVGARRRTAGDNAGTTLTLAAINQAAT